MTETDLSLLGRSEHLEHGDMEAFAAHEARVRTAAAIESDQSQ